MNLETRRQALLKELANEESYCSRVCAGSANGTKTWKQNLALISLKGKDYE